MERTSEEIIELARREIAARRERERSGREIRWRFAFIGLLGASWRECFSGPALR